MHQLKAAALLLAAALLVMAGDGAFISLALRPWLLGKQDLVARGQ